MKQRSADDFPSEDSYCIQHRLIDYQGRCILRLPTSASDPAPQTF